MLRWVLRVFRGLILVNTASNLGKQESLATEWSWYPPGGFPFAAGKGSGDKQADREKDQKTSLHKDLRSFS